MSGEERLGLYLNLDRIKAQHEWLNRQAGEPKNGDTVYRLTLALTDDKDKAADALVEFEEQRLRSASETD